MNKILKAMQSTLIVLGVMLLLSSCKKQYYTMTTTSDVNIVDYLRRYPDTYSEYVKILDRTNISPYLNAYGTYTTFAPTNDAIKAYLQEIGKNSTDELDTTTLKNICKLHIIQDTISTPSFIDGKLYAPTLYGQFLVTGVNLEGQITVNRRAVVLTPNILTGNGYIHAINKVLLPANLTIAQMVEQSNRYTIFTQALKETGFYDSLNIVNNPDTTLRWNAFLAESDDNLRKAGYTNYAALKARLCNTNNPKNPSDSLYLYMAYHIMPGLKYIADIASQQSHLTKAPKEVITVTVEGQVVKLNEAEFNGVAEAGITMNRTRSDNSCNNGVLHELDSLLTLKIRLPYRVDFELGNQPEIIKLTSTYRKVGKSQSFSYGQLADVTWQNQNLQAATYFCNASTSTDNYYWNDGFSTNLRFGNSAANSWIEFKTPLLVKGKYKIWIMYRRSNQGAYTQVSFDGVPTGRIVDFSVTLPSTAATDAQLIAQGFKRYMNDNPNSNNVAQLAGTVDVQTTDRHFIRLQAVRDFGSGATNGVTLDFIQFMPINVANEARPWYTRSGLIIP